LILEIEFAEKGSHGRIVRQREALSYRHAAKLYMDTRVFDNGSWADCAGA
jgi:hypothetical protein